MTPPTDPADRPLDQLLREVIAGEQAPDLTDRIQVAAAKGDRPRYAGLPTPVPTDLRVEPTPGPRWPFRLLATAAAVLVAMVLGWVALGGPAGRDHGVQPGQAPRVIADDGNTHEDDRQGNDGDTDLRPMDPTAHPVRPATRVVLLGDAPGVKAALQQATPTLAWTEPINGEMTLQSTFYWSDERVLLADWLAEPALIADCADVVVLAGLPWDTAGREGVEGLLAAVRDHGVELIVCAWSDVVHYMARTDTDVLPEWQRSVSRMAECQLMGANRGGLLADIGEVFSRGDNLVDVYSLDRFRLRRFVSLVSAEVYVEPEPEMSWEPMVYSALAMRAGGGVLWIGIGDWSLSQLATRHPEKMATFWQRVVEMEDWADGTRRHEPEQALSSVLYVEGRPRNEFRWLNALLEQEESIRYQAWLLSADDGWPQPGSNHTPVSRLTALPPSETPEQQQAFYDTYDVVILGDVQPEEVGEAFCEMLRTFVTEHGGGLVWIAGTENNPRHYADTPFELLVPMRLDIDPGRSAVTQACKHYRLTEAGSAHPMLRLEEDEAANRELWEESIQGFYWHAALPQAKAEATVLLEHSGVVSQQADEIDVPASAERFRGYPLMVWMPAGEGSTLYIGTDDLWRLRGGFGDRYYHCLWRQIIEHMAGDRD